MHHNQESERFCGNCGHQFGEKDTACTGCGNQREAFLAIASAQTMEIITCSSCQTMVSKNDHFCPFCGGNLSDDTLYPTQVFTKPAITDTIPALDRNPYVDWGGDFPAYSDLRGDKIWGECSNEEIIARYINSLFAVHSTSQETQVVTCNHTIGNDFVLQTTIVAEQYSGFRIVINSYEFSFFMNEYYINNELSHPQMKLKLWRKTRGKHRRDSFPAIDSEITLAFTVTKTTMVKDIKMFLWKEELRWDDTTPNVRKLDYLDLDEEEPVKKQDPEIEMHPPYIIQLQFYPGTRSFTFKNTKIWIKEE